MNNKLSVIIIAKNEEKQIETCLKSSTFADEIIIVDSGSTDHTLEIAKKYHCRIISLPFTNFSDLRNAGMKATQMSWILYVDADEEITPDLQQEIKGVVSNKDDISAYKIHRKNYYLGKLWPVEDSLERLFKKDKLKDWYGEVHESAKTEGQTGQLQHFLIHRTHNSLEEMLANTIVWSDFEAKARYQSHHPKVTWWRIFRMMMTSFWDSYIRQKGWTVGTAGLIESMYQSFSTFVTYAKLWELQNNNR